MKKKVRVLAFGTFDHFHAGHEAYLTQAAALGDELIVVIARNETVTHLKGRAPDTDERERLKRVKAAKIAGKVVLGELKNKYAVIEKFRPGVIALGYDQFAFTHRLHKFLIDSKIDAKIVRIPPFKPAVYKSSLIRTRTLPND